MPSLGGPPPAPTPELTRDYCGPFIYENGTLARILFDGGYITFDEANNNTPEYHFYTKDHLGHVRLVQKADGTIEEVNHYYPYGTLFGESTGLSNTTQPYKYSGKELDRMHGLDLHDHGARWSDTNLARWHVMDPLAEKFYDTSPYVLCADNPISNIDSDGRKVYATSIVAQRIIYKTLNKKERSYVRFNKYGELNTKRLNRYHGNSDNFTALKTLANSNTLYFYSVGESDINGDRFYQMGDNVHNPENYSYGVTNLPDVENNSSPDSNVYIYTADFLSEKEQVGNAAHELYGHAYFYELSKTDSSINPSHTKENVNTGELEYDPDFGFYYKYVFVPSNTRLEDWIKQVVQQALINYEQ